MQSSPLDSRRFMLGFLVISAICTVLAEICLASPIALSFSLGWLLIFVDFALWKWSLEQIFRKKFVALAIGLIVIKYPTIGLFVYYLASSDWLEMLWFVAGIAVLLPASLVFTISFGRTANG